MSKAAHILLLVGSIAVAVFMLGMTGLLIYLGHYLFAFPTLVLAGMVGYFFAYSGYLKVKQLP